MNINSPIFVPQQQQQQQQHSLDSSSKGSNMEQFAVSLSPNYFRHLPAYYQQQRMRQQNMNYFQQQQQRNFYNPNYHYQWSNMSLAQQRPKHTTTNAKSQYKLQQQQQQHKSKYMKPGDNNTVSKIAKISLSKTVTSPTTTTTTTTTTAAITVSATICKPEARVQTKKIDTMQRNGSRVSQNLKSHHNHQQQQPHGKSDSSEAIATTNGHHSHHHHHHHQHSQHNNLTNTKQRKSRGNHKRQDANRAPTQKHATTITTTSATTTSTGFSVDAWLGQRDLVYCYERQFISSCVEDNIMPRHNPAHRNSTSSDAAASDDLNSSSSNEDLSAAYAVMAKSAKKSTKPRQKRQQKRKQQSNATTNDSVCTSKRDDNTPMDIDEDSKENCRPPNSNIANATLQLHQQQRHGKTPAAGTTNLRKQCTKAAAFKSINKQTNNGSSKHNNSSSKCSNNTHNALTTSASNSSVCSTLSSASSTLSLSSSSCISSSSASNSPTNSANCSPTASPTVSKRKHENYKKIARAFSPQMQQENAFYMSESELIHQLRRYVIDPNLLRVYGYPVESAIHDGCIEIYKCIPKSKAGIPNRRLNSAVAKSNIINTNDGLNTNDNNLASSDSGQGTEDSSPPSMDSDASEVGEDESTGIAAFYTPDGTYQIFSHYDQSLEKQCVRCNRYFHVTQAGEYLQREPCVFHWGKLNQMFTPDKGLVYQYSCCNAEQYGSGCSANELHVWTGAVVGLNGPYTDFVHTRTRHGAARQRKVYALDCEMSFTGRGLEVTKITVVGYNGELVYEHCVLPDVDIVDYNTRFSGITEKDLCRHSNKNVKTLREVQHDLLQLFDADTILIGHGLDNDLRVLRIVHKTIIDTSITFPHSSGFPYRRALKHLAKLYLNTDIQCGNSGHSSYEDSKACMDIMVWKARKAMLSRY